MSRIRRAFHISGLTSWLRQRWLVLTWAGAIVLLPAAAYAHVIYEGGYIWENGNGKCLWEHAELSHGDGGGFAQSTPRAVTETSTPTGDVECWQDWNRPAYYLGARNLLTKWYGDQWYVCVDGDWKWNQQYTDQITKTSVYHTPCGAGYYANFGGGVTYFNDRWHGGHLYSGYHYLPS